MQLWQLRTFCVVAKTLHFRRAAEELNLSQPAVSHQIKSLEEEIGEPLFLREKDGVLLTKVGEKMVEHATKILDIADELRLEIRENEEVLSGKIILGVATRGLSHTFPSVYRRFKKLYPQIDIIFQIEYKFDDIVNKVREGTIDIGMVSHELDLTGLVSAPYGEYDLILVVGANHRFATKKEISIEELKNEDWVMFEEGNRLRGSIQQILSQEGIVPNIVYETNDATIMRSMIMQDNKISFVPRWGVLEDLKDGKLIEVKIKDKSYQIEVYLIWKPSRLTKTMGTVLSYLIEDRLKGIKSLAEE